MELFTSYYARNGKHPSAISISAKAPFYYAGKTYPPLAPSWDLLKAYKSGTIDSDGYTAWYLKILIEERKLDPNKVIEELGDGAVMLCYEKIGDFCHRHVVADWLNITTGIKVTELINW